MYVPGSSQCSYPNSESPMLQSEIDGQNAFIASVGTAFDDGDDTLNSLIEQMGGNPAGDTTSGAQGVPTTGTLDTNIPGIPVVPDTTGTQALLPNVNNPQSWAWPSSPVAPQLVRGGGAGMRTGRAKLPAQRYRNVPKTTQPNFDNPPANCPVIVPLVTAIPIPESLPAPAAPASTPAAAPPTATAAPSNCRTGNICLDIMNGCVLSSQVSVQQLAACSAAGYAGNRNLFPAIAAAGGADGGANFGTPMPNPPPYTPGMSGFGQSETAQQANAGVFDNIFESLVTAIATAAAFAILWKGRKGF